MTPSQHYTLGLNLKVKLRLGAVSQLKIYFYYSSSLTDNISPDMPM